MKSAIKPFRWLWMVCLLLLLSGCSGVSKPLEEGEKVREEVFTAHNAFAFDLYQQVLKESKGDNPFLSPLSISLVLSMALNGADQETKDAMVQALGVQDFTTHEINQANAALLSLLERTGPDVDLRLAQSLWGQQGTPFQPDFLQANQRFYHAQITELDFSEPDAARTINQWVQKATEGKINQIVDNDIDPDTFLFLINAVYFKGEWAEPFPELHTRDEAFYLSDGNTQTVSMMTQTGKYDYFKGDGFQAARLPYGNDRLGMILFLPDEGTNLSQLYEQLKLKHWNAWMGKWEQKAGTVHLPRFQLEFETTLNTALQALGMDVAFDPDQADFSRLVTPPPNAYIHEVKHRSFIEVNEKGTEAAGSTSTEMKIISAPEDSFQMRVNRPFFFVIHDKETGVILFMGSVTKPNS
jgi:serine protease inhibitor